MDSINKNINIVHLGKRMNWQCNYFCNQFENIIFINLAGVGELLVHFESPAPRWSNAGLVGFIISGIWISANTIYKAIIISIQFTLIPKFYCHYLCPVSWFWWLLNDWMRYDALFCRLLQEVGTGVLETGVQSETRLISRNFGKHHWILDDGIFLSQISTFPSPLLTATWQILA